MDELSTQEPGMDPRAVPSPSGEAPAPNPFQEEEKTGVSRGIVLYRSAMMRSFGLAFYALGLGFLLRSLRMEDHSADRIRRGARSGPVVYVLDRRSLLDLLALNVALNANRLPLASFANGVRLTLFMPIREMLSTLAQRIRRWQRKPLEHPLRAGFMADLLQRGAHACLFLSPAPTLWQRLFRRDEPDPVPALLDAQLRSSRPIAVVPVVVIWNRAPPAARSEVGRFLLGNQDVPGFFGKIWAALARTGHVFVQAGEPIDLQQYLAREEASPDARKVRVLRLLLSRYLFREQAVVRGPRMRSPGWMKRLVLQNPGVREAVRQEAQAEGISEHRVHRKVEALYDRIAARFSFTLVLAAATLTRWVWSRIFAGVDLRRSDFDLVRQALRRGTPVLVPCHRSHVDYLLLSSILFQHDLVIPHIVAGINLSFWPMGAIFRRLGAFFVKRSFSGDRLFPAVFSSYVHQLVRDGFPIEFFIEGGRSRTGKLLPPKLGVLSMLMDAAALARRDDFDVTFLPVNISYEHLAEEGAYMRELAGEKKQSESLRDVARVQRVLRTRYGRVYLRFGTPISANEIFASLPRPWNELDRERRQEVLAETGERILHRINQQSVTMPTSLLAAAFLAQTRRGIRRELLLSRTRRFLAILEGEGIEASATLSNPEWALQEALKRFLASKRVLVFDDEDGPIYRITDEGRLALDFYKNNILQPFVPASLLGLALRRALGDTEAADSGSQTARIGDVLSIVQSLMYLFRHEFIFDTESTNESVVDHAILQLERHGAIAREGELLRVLRPALLDEVAALTSNFVESYWLVLKVATGHAREQLDREALIRRVLRQGQGMLAVEELQRPEALSTANVGNAIRVFVEDGVLRAEKDGRCRDLDPSLAKVYLDLLGSMREGRLPRSA